MTRKQNAYLPHIHWDARLWWGTVCWAESKGNLEETSCEPETRECLVLTISLKSHSLSPQRNQKVRHSFRSHHLSIQWLRHSFHSHHLSIQSLRHSFHSHHLSIQWLRQFSQSSPLHPMTASQFSQSSPLHPMTASVFAVFTFASNDCVTVFAVITLASNDCVSFRSHHLSIQWLCQFSQSSP
jgi:hypothetical protein